jgi:ABC-2 type transport system permease protein
MTTDLAPALRRNADWPDHSTPLSYEVDALRGLLLGTRSHILADFGVLAVAAMLGIGVAASLLDRLAR